MSPKINVKKMAIAAKKASHELAKASTEQKNAALFAIIKMINQRKDEILLANREDIKNAEIAGLSESLIDRLSLQNRLPNFLSDIEQVINLPDPIGEYFEEQHKHQQLEISKCRTPIGVLGVIYESRPNVTLDVSALTIKSGNCAILRGGSETLKTNLKLVEAIQEALISENLPKNTIQLIQNSERAHVMKLLKMHEYIDLIIPRGGAALHKFCREKSTIPVITGGVGVCHLFVDETADIEKSLPVILNAKTQRPTVCNALDTLLVHENIAALFIPRVVTLLNQKGVCFKVDMSALELLQNSGRINCDFAKPEDWDTEWLSLVLGIKVVNNLEEAIAHVTEHSTGHSDGILTQDKANAARFVKEIDSAAVYVNASTRFTDGGQLGLGSEVAISTQKLHARGPMGLKELTSYKWVIHGDYACRN